MHQVEGSRVQKLSTVASPKWQHLNVFIFLIGLRVPFHTVNAATVVLMQNKLYLSNNIVFLQQLKETSIYEASF